MIPSLFLAVALSLGNPLRDGVALSRSHEYEAAEAVFAQVAPKDRDNSYYFYRLLDCYSLNRKAEGLQWADLLLEPGAFGQHEPCPARYEVVGSLMRDDMLLWKDNPGELDGVARDMRTIGDRLGVGKGGDKTHGMEQDVLARLDKKIRELEEKEKQQQQDASKGQDKPEDGANHQKPADDSQIAQESGKGLIDTKKLKVVADAWGKLPDKERAAAMRDLTKDLPPDMRETVERYFAELSRKQAEGP